MKHHKSALAALVLTLCLAGPSAAQQAPWSPQALPNETCAGCFAYLEFSPSLEPESFAIRGQTVATSTPTPAEAGPNDRVGEQTASLVVTAKQ